MFAIVLDVVYQILVLRFVYPGELILVAILLAILPYLILRGPVNRIARMMMCAQPSSASHARELQELEPPPAVEP